MTYYVPRRLELVQVREPHRGLEYGQILNNEQDVMRILAAHKPCLWDRADERFAVIPLDARLRVLGVALTGGGATTHVTLEARVIAQICLLANAVAVLLVHNHPSGDPTPSDRDIAATQHLVKALRLLNIELIDHLVVTGPDSWAKVVWIP